MAVYKYTHQKTGEEMEAISGHYSIENEGRLTYKNRQVYYYTGCSVIDTSCCGPGGGGFAFVIGYIVNWKNSKDDNGTDISDIEPIADNAERQEIRKLIIKLTYVQQVNFWSSVGKLNRK